MIFGILKTCHGIENYKFLCKCVYNLLSTTNLVCCNSNINLILILFLVNKECKFSFVALFQMWLWIILWSLKNVVSYEVFLKFLFAILCIKILIIGHNLESIFLRKLQNVYVRIRVECNGNEWDIVNFFYLCTNLEIFLWNTSMSTIGDHISNIFFFIMFFTIGRFLLFHYFIINVRV
jgi:hypothetical protein